MKVFKECCVNSFKEAIESHKKGADRIELCAELVNGGVTPSYGTIKIVNEELDIPIFVIIRPRPGDFLYTDEEKLIMYDDIVSALKLNSDGIVFGALTSKGKIDIDFCKKVLETINQFNKDNKTNVQTTFHMAFDYLIDKYEGISILSSMNIDRILTRGGESGSMINNEENLVNIRSYMEHVKKMDLKIKIMPGGGISHYNINDVILKIKDLYDENDIIELHGSKII